MLNQQYVIGMVLIEKPPGFGFHTSEAVIALDFQPHPLELTNSVDQKGGWIGVERLAGAAGSLIKIWSFSFCTFPPLKALGTFGPTVSESGPDEQYGIPVDTVSSVDENPDSEGSRKKRRIDGSSDSCFDSSSVVASPTNSSNSRSASPQPRSSNSNAKPVPSCRCHTRCVAILRDHAPSYLVGLRWSPNGKAN